MKKVTITKAQYDTIKGFLNDNCFAVAYELTCKFLFGKSVKEIKDAYFSAEYNTAMKLTNAVYYNYKYLKVVEA